MSSVPFWDYFRQHWQRDAGLRIDHLLLNKALANGLRAAGVDRWVRGEEHASDITDLGKRASAGQGVADERVAAMMDD
jgi:exonuclease III